MAKIGTAHVELKPVLNEEALNKITASIEEAVRKGVEAGLRSALLPKAPSAGTITVLPGGSGTISTQPWGGTTSSGQADKK